VAKKAKPGRPSISAGGPQHQDHAMLASWEMPRLCKGGMIKRLLIAHVPKQRKSG